MSSFTPAGTAYLAARAIDAELAFGCGVREVDGAIVWPTVDAGGKFSPRRRRLAEGAGPKVRGLKGRTLGVWWPLGRPERISGDVLICEGESDAMAAACAARGAKRLNVCSGTAATLDVLLGELIALHAEVTALGFDGDIAGDAKTDKIAMTLVGVGICARVLPIPPDEDLGSVLGAVSNPTAWLIDALLRARPVGLGLASLVAENRWLRETCLELQRREVD